MAEYFQNPDDLRAWVRSRGSYDQAAKELLNMINSEEDLSQIPDDEQDIVDTCQAIYEQEDQNASEILFGVLAKHNITKLQKKASSMEKTAQSDSRQRNDWTRAMRNKWNRSVDGYLDGTPWRVGRDEYYDFTHYATDEIKFDEDPQHIYSGEAIWRMYIMDKFYRDYKDKDGHVVGGYINDRFHVFPTAGTPANPDVPRDHGNQMELPDGVRTRQPKPSEYSVERRLEEARGNKTESITCAAESFDKVIKVASTTHVDEAKKDRIFNMFKDTIEMREAGIKYETMIEAIADHYKASVLGVAQIDKIAQKLVAKHTGIGYEANVKMAYTLAEIVEQTGSGDTGNVNMTIAEPNGVQAVLSGDQNQPIQLNAGTIFVNIPNMPNVFEVVDHPADATMVGARVSFTDMNFEVSPNTPIQDAAAELGLNEGQLGELQQAMEEGGFEGSMGFGAGYGTGIGTDFAVTEMPA